MQIKRKHNAITFDFEKTILDTIASRIFSITTADQLSILALFGVCIAAGAYIFAPTNIQLLHIANIGIVLHWFGDSLDGRVARLRKESRPILGHYIDHIVDAISLVVITFGITYSELTLQSAWVWVLTLFLLIMIHSFLRASLTGDFELTIERFGPTEARITLIAINLLVIMTNNTLLTLTPIALTVLDAIGMIIALTLLVSFIKVVYMTLKSSSSQK